MNDGRLARILALAKELVANPSAQEMERLFMASLEELTEPDSVEESETSWDDTAFTVTEVHDDEASRPALDELMALTGLEEVKEFVLRQISFHKVMGVRRSMGLKTPKRNLHMLLTGNPGTGKTTVARLIGKIYQQLGLLTSGHLVEADRASLVDRWIGGTEHKTTELIESARGGILFIDEIYSLTDGDDGHSSRTDFGGRVMDTLMPILSDVDSNLMVIGAGYPDRIKNFLKSNPGLTSRFPQVLNFRDFDEEELCAIAVNELARYNFNLGPGAEECLRGLLRRSKGMADFGNARTVMTIVDNFLIPNLCDRLAKNPECEKMDVETASEIRVEDFPPFEELFPLVGKTDRRVGFQPSRY